MGRAPCCDKASVKKGPWSPDEDAKLKSYIEKNGTGGNWIALPQKIGLTRCGKSCRLRWLNYLRPDIKHGDFSEEEDNIIISLYTSIGSRWSVIAAQLPGRTDNDVKNYWNTRLKKKLLPGRDHPYGCRRRSAGCAKQGTQVAEKRTTTSFKDAAGCSRQVPYTPQVPGFSQNQDHLLLHVVAASTGGHGSSDGHFPVDVGGELLDDIHEWFPDSYPAPSSAMDQQTCGQTSMVGLIPPPPPPPPQPSFSINCSSPLDGRLLQSSGGRHLMSELEEILCCNSMKTEGLNSFHGVIGDANGTLRCYH